MQQEYRSQGQTPDRETFEHRQAQFLDKAMDDITHDRDIANAVDLIGRTTLPPTIKEWAQDEIRLIGERL